MPLTEMEMPKKLTSSSSNDPLFRFCCRNLTTSSRGARQLPPPPPLTFTLTFMTYPTTKVQTSYCNCQIMTIGRRMYSYFVRVVISISVILYVDDTPDPKMTGYSKEMCIYKIYRQLGFSGEVWYFPAMIIYLSYSKVSQLVMQTRAS